MKATVTAIEKSFPKMVEIADEKRTFEPAEKKKRR